MRFIAISLIFLGLSLSVVAEEKSGEGLSDAVGETRNLFDGKEWIKKQNKLKELEVKVLEIKREVKRLIVEKNTTKDGDRRHELIPQIESSHKELDKVIEEYRQVQTELRYKYPERFATTGDRKYIKFRKQSLEEIESEMGLDQRLTTVKRQVDEKYKSFWEEEKGSKPVSETERQVLELKKKKKENKRLRLVK